MLDAPGALWYGRSLPNAPKVMTTDDDEIELGWYLRELQRRWKLAVAGALIGGALGFGYASLQPLRYEGVTAILVPPNNPQLSPATFRAIAQNATLASQVISELKLGEGEGALTPARFVEDALRVDEVRGTPVVRVKVTLPDPRTAAEASRAVAEKAIALTREVIPQSITSTIEEQLQSRLGDAQHEIANAQQALMNHKTGAHGDLFGKDSPPEPKRQADLLHLLLEIEGEDARLTLAEAAIKEQAQRLTRPRVTVRPATPKTTGVSDGQLLESLPDNPPTNPVYETLRVQIAVARDRREALEQQHDSLISSKKIGRTELAALRDRFQPQIERVRLQARLDLARKVRDDLAVRYEEIRSQPSIRQLAVIDGAQPPDHPLSRRRLHHATYGAAAGLVLTVVLVPLWQNRGRRS